LAGYVVYTSVNCLLVSGAAYVVTTFAPAAAGSGIPEVKSYLNGLDLPVLSFKTLVGKVVGCVLSVAGGLVVGKEGPLVHVGACIASLLSESTGELARDGRLPPTLKGALAATRAQAERRDTITCGACAGVAAAFRAPVGGVLFAIEEISSFWSQSLLWRAFFATAVVSVTVRSLLKSCADERSCGFFGSGGLIMFDISEGGQSDFYFLELVPMCILGAMGGLLGSSFNFLSGRVCAVRQAFFRNRGHTARVWEAFAVALVTSTLMYCIPMAFRCRPCPDASVVGEEVCPRPQSQHHGNYIHFHCLQDASRSGYSDIATIFFNTSDDAIRNLFSPHSAHEFSVDALVTSFLLYFIMAVMTYGVSIPSGLFIPCILCGACYGRLLGMAVTALGGAADIDEGTYALLGAASFLAGAMRMTVSLCVILLELTNNLQLLPLVMLVLLVAKIVGDATGVQPIYDLHITMKGVPFLEAEADPGAAVRAGDLVKAQSVVTLGAVETVENLLETLKSCDHNCFPVVKRLSNGSESLLGTVLRSRLLQALRYPNLLFGSSEAEVAREEVLQMVDEVEAAGAAELGDVLALLGGQNDKRLNLEPLVNATPYVVPEDASLAKAYPIFRQLGLRHLLVVPPPSRVTGVITRQDLTAHVRHPGGGARGCVPGLRKRAAAGAYEEHEDHGHAGHRV